MKPIKRTQYGFEWDGMELSCLFDDERGRVFMKIKRGNKAHQVYVTKTGKLVTMEIKDNKVKE